MLFVSGDFNLDFKERGFVHYKCKWYKRLCLLEKKFIVHAQKKFAPKKLYRILRLFVFMRETVCFRKILMFSANNYHHIACRVLGLVTLSCPTNSLEVY